jgi:hypothetical protein
MFYNEGEPVSTSLEGDLLVPRDELDIDWISNGVNPNYANAFPNYEAYSFMEDGSQMTSFRAYFPGDYYSNGPNRTYITISDGLIVDFSQFQIVLFDEDGTIQFTSDIMLRDETFADTDHVAEGNHYFIYHLDTNELEMIPYEDTTSDPEDLVLVLGILAVFAIVIAMGPYILIWLGVATILFIIMIVWIKKGQPQSPKRQ